jgi:hypothetical protein
MSDVQPRFRWIQVVGLLLAASAAAQQPNLKVDELLALADRPWRAFPEAVIHATVTVLEDGKVAQTAEMEIYRKPPDSSLVEFTAGTQKGRKVLTVGANVWLIVPGARNAVPVSANQRLMGGAGLADLAGLRFSDLAATPLEPVEQIDGTACDVLELHGKGTGTAKASERLWLDRAEHLPRKLLLLLPSGKPVRELYFEGYAIESGTPVVSQMRIVDLLVTARRTETRVVFSKYRKARLGDELFVPPGGSR